MVDFAWNTFLLYSLIGFFAQIIDGSMGMAYGVITNSLLLSIGISPLTASASVHVSKVFTTLISGLSHLKFKNVHKGIIRNLIIPGVLGGIAGAYLLVKVSGDVLQPIIGGYLLIMGVRIFIKAFNRTQGFEFRKIHYVILGWFGGFFDAIGGGGWGPIVTSTLLSKDEEPRKIIGSVNIAEFFVSFAQSLFFIAGIGVMPFEIVIGLIIGGAIAAPIAAYLTAKIPTKVMYLIVGLIIILMQIRLFVELLW
ncbi:MAG: sulfite exporter TauE/SafE family protein [Chloroflexota bacterium]|nr:sulfite exporter TauE/SafE family protein [Chloroflexota bacterium]